MWPGGGCLVHPVVTSAVTGGRAAGRHPSPPQRNVLQSWEEHRTSTRPASTLERRRCSESRSRGERRVQRCAGAQRALSRRAPRSPGSRHALGISELHGRLHNHGRLEQWQDAVHAQPEGRQSGCALSPSAEPARRGHGAVSESMVVSSVASYTSTLPRHKQPCVSPNDSCASTRILGGRGCPITPVSDQVRCT